jgi:hypothetical protein
MTQMFLDWLSAVRACQVGYNEFDFFQKMKNTDPLRVQNWNLRHIYEIRFLIFWADFARLASKFEKSTNMT